MENTNGTMTVKVSGSKLIRAAFKTAGLEASGKEIVDAVQRDHGVEVTESLVNNIRFRLRKEKEERKVRRKRGQPVPEQVPEQVGYFPTEVSGEVLQTEFDRFMAVKDLATKVGGLSSLRDLIDRLDKLRA